MAGVNGEIKPAPVSASARTNITCRTACSSATVSQKARGQSRSWVEGFTQPMRVRGQSFRIWPKLQVVAAWGDRKHRVENGQQLPFRDEKANGEAFTARAVLLYEPRLSPNPFRFTYRVFKSRRSGTFDLRGRPIFRKGIILVQGPSLTNQILSMGTITRQGWKLCAPQQ